MANIYPNINAESKLTKIVPVPSLSTLGYVRDSANKFDLLLSHAFVADYNQTYLYKGNTISIPRLIEIGGSDADKMIQTIKSAFYSYFSKYYDKVDITCSIIENAPNVPPGAIGIEIYFTIVEANVQTSYSRIINTENGKLKNIIKLNNFG